MNRSNMANDWQEALIDKPDFLKQAVQAFVQTALEEEFRKFIGADEGQRTEEKDRVPEWHLPKAAKDACRQSQSECVP